MDRLIAHIRTSEPTKPATNEQLSRANACRYAQLCLREDHAYVAMQIANMYGTEIQRKHFEAVYRRAYQNLENFRLALRREGIPAPVVILNPHMRIKMAHILRRLGITLINQSVSPETLSVVLEDELPYAHNE